MGYYSAKKCAFPWQCLRHWVIEACLRLASKFQTQKLLCNSKQGCWRLILWKRCAFLSSAGLITSNQTTATLVIPLYSKHHNQQLERARRYVNAQLKKQDAFKSHHLLYSIRNFKMSLFLRISFLFCLLLDNVVFKCKIGISLIVLFSSWVLR